MFVCVLVCVCLMGLVILVSLMMGLYVFGVIGEGGLMGFLWGL